MASTIRWGILGTGDIARGFAEDLRTIPDAALVAVGSRDEATARAFAVRFHAPHAHASYEAAVTDPDVDIVYVATPHYRHRDDTLLALAAGKPVLCEKPFTLNAAQAREVVAVARARQLFCMEAMWTRFLPILGEVRRRIAAGEVGDLRAIAADFGYANEGRAGSRLFDPRLGGGALLDRSVYGVSLAHWLFGAPSVVHGVAALGPTGVDEHDAVVLGWPDGRIATITASIVARTGNTATLTGTRGSIVLEEPFCCPPGASLTRFSAPPAGPAPVRPTPALLRRVLGRVGARVRRGTARIVAVREGHGYRYEAIEAMRCLRAGAIESEIMPLDDSVSVMETLDRVRAEIGLGYPGEPST